MTNKIHEDFIKSIRNYNIVELEFFSKEDNSTLVRRCIPMDYAISRKDKNKKFLYHFMDLNSDSGKPHPLRKSLEEIISMKIIDEKFDPSTFVNWDLSKSPWNIKRDWGNYS